MSWDEGSWWGEKWNLFVSRTHQEPLIVLLLFCQPLSHTHKHEHRTDWRPHNYVSLVQIVSNTAKRRRLSVRNFRIKSAGCKDASHLHCTVCGLFEGIAPFKYLSNIRWWWAVLSVWTVSNFTDLSYLTQSPPPALCWHCTAFLLITTFKWFTCNGPLKSFFVPCWIVHIKQLLWLHFVSASHYVKYKY